MTEAQFAAHQERVKTARRVKLMDGEPEMKRATKANREAKPKAEPKLENPLEAQLEEARERNRVRLLKIRPRWSYESRLAQQLEDAGIHGFFVDAEYIENRGLRADILFPLHKLAVEIQGQVHRIKGKWQSDILKAQATILAGYRLLPIATSQVRDGTAVEIIRRALHVEHPVRTPDEAIAAVLGKEVMA